MAASALSFQLLAHHACEEAAHRVLLPPGDFHDGRDRRSLGATQHCNHLGLFGTRAHYGVAGCLSGLARFRRLGGRFLRQFVSRGRLVVDPDRLTASPGDAQGVRIVPIAAPHRQRTPGLDLLDEAFGEEFGDYLAGRAGGQT
jgi:hypothetical protein